MLKRIRPTAKRLFSTGFFHIVGSGTINKVVQTLLSVVLVRILTRAEYGVYAYAYNIISFFALFNGLGMASALLQVCSEQFDDQARMASSFRYGMRVGTLFDVGVWALILLAAAVAPLAISGGRLILALYSFLPLGMYLNDMKLTQLRVLLMNREYSLITNLHTILVAVSACVGAWIAGAEGLAVGQTVSQFLAYAIASALYPHPFGAEPQAIGSDNKRDIVRLGIISALNNGIVQALTLVGTFLIGSLMANGELVASYKVATTIPFALLFVPSMLVTYIMPYFARHREDRVWTLQNFARVIGASTVTMGGMCLTLSVLAERMVSLIFGNEYLDCVTTLRILLLGLFVSASFRVPTGNLLVTQRKLKTNIFIGLLSIAVDIAASYMLIPTMGPIGAAIAYDATMLLGAILNVALYLRAVISIGESNVGQT